MQSYKKISKLPNISFLDIFHTKKSQVETQNLTTYDLLFMPNKYYFVAFSRRFIITNMNKAESKHNVMNTAQTDHNGSPAQRKPPTETRMLPKAVATNQPPIIRPLYLGGATFETKEIPIGESSNPAKVKIR